jgi:hypothetical protein
MYTNYSFKLQFHSEPKAKIHFNDVNHAILGPLLQIHGRETPNISFLGLHGKVLLRRLSSLFLADLIILPQ